MTYEEKYQLWLEFGRSKKFGENPIDRLFRRFGFKFPPLVFWSLPVLFIFNFSFQILIMGILALIMQVQFDKTSTVILLSLVLVSLGIFQTRQYARAKKYYELPTWENFPKQK